MKFKIDFFKTCFLALLVSVLGILSSCENAQTTEALPTEDEIAHAMAADSSFIQSVRENIAKRQLIAAGEIVFGSKDITSELKNAKSAEECYKIYRENFVKGADLYIELQRNSEKYDQKIVEKFWYLYEPNSPFDLDVLDRISGKAREIVEARYQEDVKDIGRLKLWRLAQKPQD